MGVGEEFGVDTPSGPAWVRLDRPTRPAGSLLVLGHGAGGDIDAPDLVAVRDAAVAAGVAVARVRQPYRVAGRRAPAPARQLDAAFVAAVTDIALVHRRHVLPAGRDVPVLVGGRSSGARVACRTAESLSAVGVVALAFPLHPPKHPDRSRASELPPDRPTLVVNGARDPFGVPAAGGPVEVVVRAGETHALSRDPAGAAGVVVGWLARHGWAVPT